MLPLGYMSRARNRFRAVFAFLGLKFMLLGVTGLVEDVETLQAPVWQEIGLRLQVGALVASVHPPNVVGW